MAEINFNDYYQQVLDRDEKIAEEKPLPEVKGLHFTVMLGLAIGIGSILFSVLGSGSVVLGVVALLLSIYGCTKEKENRIATAAVTCSVIGLVLSVSSTLTYYFYGEYILEYIKLSIWNYLQSL